MATVKDRGGILKDTGCKYNEKCMTCPYPCCIVHEVSVREAQRIAKKYKEAISTT